MNPILQALKLLWKFFTNPDVYRFTLRTLWLFFPSFIFLLLCLIAFWNISQGQDLMVYTIEYPRVYILFFIAMLFFAFTIWYSSRLVAKAKFWQNKYYLWLKLRVHMPRLLGFTSISIIILAFLQLKIDESPQISRNLAWFLFVLFIPWYYLLDYICHRLVFIKKISATAMWVTVLCLLAVCLLAVFTLNRFTGLVAVLLVLQISMVVYFILRRMHLLAKTGQYAEAPKDFNDKKGLAFINASLRQLFRDPEEKANIKIFNWVAVVAFAIYISAIGCVWFSVKLGAFPFVFLAFGVLAGFINFVSTISIFSRFNFHILFFAAAFIFGNLHDPHKVQLVKKETPSSLWSKRQNLKEYFTAWVKDRFQDSAVKKIPVYFVLSDGGASRSGYWVSSVLSRFEDSLGSKFSDNLFCLSGASGGSVGNAAFYNLLRLKKSGQKIISSFQKESKAYLGSDFLSYTLARMLGPDFFRYVFFPALQPVKDRAFALTVALEKASPDSAMLDGILSTGLSSLITQNDQPFSGLPVLCINTTRMQDGTPGVISTISMGDSFFNKRVDVLGLLKEEEDLKLSSAVVLGASFPYVSPAGRIDKLIIAKKKNGEDSPYYRPHYFVDGGYFDNSGAGVVNEMLIAMDQMMRSDPYLASVKNKLDFYVLHMTNDPHPDGVPVLNKVNPLVNDLAAPLQTLAGAYGSQTSVNDSRLKNYMKNNFGEGHYLPFNLYKKNDSVSFSMNWVISERIRDSMDSRLEFSDSVKNFIKRNRQ